MRICSIFTVTSNGNSIYYTINSTVIIINTGNTAYFSQTGYNAFVIATINCIIINANDTANLTALCKIITILVDIQASCYTKAVYQRQRTIVNTCHAAKAIGTIITCSYGTITITEINSCFIVIKTINTNNATSA